MNEIMENDSWSEWRDFSDPRNKGFIYAPFGCGVYQLKNVKTNQYVLFGSGSNCAYRMTSLLPKPLGAGTRKNKEKRNYVLENLMDIQYRTIAFSDNKSMKDFEKLLKKCTQHIFKT